MLHVYLEDRESDRLIKTMRSRKKPTVFCFCGDEQSGKTIVAKHFSALLDDVFYFPRFVGIKPPKKIMKFIIYTINDIPELEQVKAWCKKYGYIFDEPYIFKKNE